MTNTSPSVEKLLSLLKGSPEVKVLIDREKRQAEDAEKQARIDCLARIKSLQLVELETKQKLDAALSAVAAAEAKVSELKTKVAITSTAHTEAQHKRGASASELIKLHGEGVVLQTLYSLDRLIKKQEIEIKDMEASTSPYLKDVDGYLTMRPVHPKLGSHIKTKKQCLEGIQKLYEKTKDFVGAEMAPSEIKELCESICSAAGLQLQPANSVEAVN
jgi:hypothetical protein